MDSWNALKEGLNLQETQIDDSLTFIASVLDRSGSMNHLVSDVIGGYNTFIQQQAAEPGSAVCALTIFDAEIDIVYSGLAINEVAELTTDVYFARGNTALLDAVGKTILELENSISTASVKPGKVIVVIHTDGQENASKEFTNEKLKELMGTHDDWQFVFMGAGQDAWANAQQWSTMSAGSTLSHANTSAGYAGSYTSLNSSVSNLRSSSAKNSETFWKDGEEKDSTQE